MRLLLIRHGQTPCNVAGELDTAFPGAPLTALGVLQADAVPAALAAEDVAAVYASPLVRAQATAAPLARARGVEVVVVDGFEEISAGALEMRSDEEAYSAFRACIAAWIQGDLGSAVPEAPDGHAFHTRFDDALRRVAHGHGPDDTVAVVSHGAAIRVWAGAHSDVDPDEMVHMHLGNTGVAAFEGDPESGWSLVSWSSDPLGGHDLEDQTAVDPTADQGDPAGVSPSR